MRTRGSVRFEPYYKVQWFDPVTMAWRDVQRAYTTADEAQDNAIPGKQCRVMVITMQGRAPLTIR